MSMAIVVAELVDTVIYASVAGVGVSIVFSIAIYGATRCADLGRDERPVAAVAAGLVALVAFLVCMAAAVGSILLMVD